MPEKGLDESLPKRQYLNPEFLNPPFAFPEAEASSTCAFRQISDNAVGVL
jgi:hypothetical protein